MAQLYGTDPAFLSPTAAKLLRRGWLKWAIALSASLGAILEVIDTVITNVALPDIRGTLGATLAEAGWVSTGYACANVVIIPLSAWLGDRFGRKNYFVFSLVGFTGASVLCGLSNNLGMLIAARVLQGLAGGGLLAKAQSVVFEAFAPHERGAAQAVFGLGVIVGPAVGPVLGGWLTDNLGWRWIFFINVPVGIISVLMCLLFLPNDDPKEIKRSSVDWTGIALLALGLASFQILLEEGQQHDWLASPYIRTMAVLSVVGTALFIWHELNTPHPAVDLRVLRHRSMIGGSIYSAILGMGLYGIIFAIPVFVQGYLHFTAMQSGELLVPGAIASAIAMMLFGKVAHKFPPQLVIGTGALLTTCTGLLLMQINPSTGTGDLFWPLVLRGLGGVFMFMALSMATLGPLPKRDIAAGSGIYSLTRQLGSSIGIALITTMLYRQQAIHRAVLVEKVTAFRTPLLDRVQMLSGAFPQDPATSSQHAMGVIDVIVNAQATLLSYADLFFYVAVLFIVSLPLLLLFGGKTANAEAAAAAH
jgi:DHA2 family multidrug resistance protein